MKRKIFRFRRRSMFDLWRSCWCKTEIIRHGWCIVYRKNCPNIQTRCYYSSYCCCKFDCFDCW